MSKGGGSDGEVSAQRGRPGDGLACNHPSGKLTVLRLGVGVGWGGGGREAGINQIMQPLLPGLPTGLQAEPWPAGGRRLAHRT